MAQALTRSEVRWNEKTIGALIILALLPNLLGTINLATPWGFQIHVFQAAIFLAALIFGRWAGLIAGAAGSIYVAAALSNPFILVGNAFLGFFTGHFTERGFGPVAAVLLAFAIQIPWLAVTDHFLMGLPWSFVGALVLSLAVSNLGMGCRGFLGGRTPETVSGMLTPDFASYSLALLHGGRMVFSSEKGGVRPLVECIRACRGRFSGCELHDRAIGLAAAKLVVASGMIGRVITRRASARAVSFLEQHTVPLTADEVVPLILNREKTAPCLMEQKAEATEDPETFYREISAFFGLQP